MCMSMLKYFKKASGLELNVSKTKIMWLGREKHKQDSCCGILAVETAKILGTRFSAIKNCYNDNVSPIIENIARVTHHWGQRNLTIKGRITVAKSLLMSQIIYVASITLFERKDLEKNTITHYEVHMER